MKISGVMKAVMTITRLVTSTSEQEFPCWNGVPTKLIKKTTLVPASPNHLPVYTLTFAIPEQGNVLTGTAQPHSAVRIDMGDVVKMVIPNYKPKSYSMSAIRMDEKEFDVTIKVYPNGRASGFLDRLQIGGEDTVNTFGRDAGRRRNSGDFVGVIAYGVGITEGLPVARAELEKGRAKRVVLLWASRTMEDTFWHNEIQELSQNYPERFQIVHIFSREKRDGCLHGRIDPSVLETVFTPNERNQARFLSVGTKEMMRMTDNMLTQIGYPMPKHALLPK
jgi:NAD(P)H-flavin reductase